MNIDFVKYQACGNDYIYIDCLDGRTFDYPLISKKLGDRHFGIGGDGVVFILKSDVADCKMRMFNLDGSEGKMCGNAVRCIAKYMQNKALSNKNSVKIETLSGIKTVDFSNGLYTVDMGKASFYYPFEKDEKLSPVDFPVVVNRKEYYLNLVSVGNPHAVIFDNVDDFYEVGSSIEKNRIFHDGINVEFVTVKNNFLDVKVWERGSGKTLACGTGACAVAFSATEKGIAEKEKWQKIKMEGGYLEVLVKHDNTVFLKGDAVEVFRGSIKGDIYES